MRTDRITDVSRADPWKTLLRGKPAGPAEQDDIELTPFAPRRRNTPESQPSAAATILQLDQAVGNIQLLAYLLDVLLDRLERVAGDIAGR